MEFVSLGKYFNWGFNCTIDPECLTLILIIRSTNLSKTNWKIKLQTNIPMGHLCRVDWIIGFIQQKHPLLNNCHFCPVIVSNSILSSFSPLFYYCHGPWMTIAIVFVRFSSLFPFSAFFYVISVVAPNSFCLFDSFVNQIPNETKERLFND